jgi:hypothetical protein
MSAPPENIPMNSDDSSSFEPQKRRDSRGGLLGHLIRREYSQPPRTSSVVFQK